MNYREMIIEINKSLNRLIDLMWETLEGYNSERTNAWRERVLQMRVKEQKLEGHLSPR